MVMPQPYIVPKAGAQFWTGWTALYNRPQCSAAIGIIATQWAALESELDELASIATCTSVSHDPVSGTLSHDNNPITGIIMGTLDSLSARLDITSAIISKNFPKSFVEDFTVLAKAIRKTGGQRALAVHTNWMTLDAYPDDIVRPIGDSRAPHEHKSYIRYTQKDLLEILRYILDRQHEMRVFRFKLLYHLAGVEMPLISRIPPHEPPKI